MKQKYHSPEKPWLKLLGALWTFLILFKFSLSGRETFRLKRRIMWCPHHALQAVRQQQHDAVLSHPLGLTGTDELVDDALCCVVEVSKLSLPQDQSVRARHGETQLEACRRRNNHQRNKNPQQTSLTGTFHLQRALTEHTVLGQRAVADGVRRLVRGHVVHGDAGPLVHVLVMEDVVTVAERGQEGSVSRTAEHRWTFSPELWLVRTKVLQSAPHGTSTNPLSAVHVAL